LENPERNSCTPQDWKGDTESDATIYLIQQAHITGREYGCNLLSARPDQHWEHAIDVEFQCGGEGFDWRKSKILGLHTMGRKRLLVQLTKFSQKTVQQSARNVPVKTDMHDTIQVYQKCE
jgi:hypothetical protein